MSSENYVWPGRQLLKYYKRLTNVALASANTVS